MILITLVQLFPWTLSRLNLQVEEETRRRVEVEENHQSQLDLLMMRGQLKESELKKLGELNAELFGHANTRQKIKHVAQLKEENVKLKTVRLLRVAVH